MNFAYLIMAHNNPEQLKTLLSLLDHTENEIYLHIDKKNNDIDIDSIKKIIKKAKIHIYKKYKVYHADISQTICQTYLLEEACKKYHDYYHLISNADLPIKTHKKILDFFEQNMGKQFIHFESDNYSNKFNCSYYHFLSSIIKKINNKLLKKVLTKIEKLSLFVQKIINIQRKFYCGANWYSITHDLAVDFCKHKEQILRKVKWTLSSDELVLQMFVRCISTKEYQLYALTKHPNDYNSLKRSIDWERGFPYVWRYRDYEELIKSDNLFGRKFDITVDDKIIKDIVQHVNLEQ